MGKVALRMLFGDPGKYLGLVFGIAFATLLMAQQAGLFVGILGRTVSQIVDVQEADLWVMDPRVKYSDVNEPMTDTQLYRRALGRRGRVGAALLSRDVDRAFARRHPRTSDAAGRGTTRR